MNDILLKNKFLTEEECHNFILKSESLGFKKAEQWDKGRHNKVIRLNTYEDRKKIATTLQSYFESKTLILGPVLEFYKYEPGYYVSAHTDALKEIAPYITSNRTLVIYLNENYSGGETYFEALKRNILPKTGKALLFKQEGLVHTGNTVSAGIKYILRADVYSD